VHSHNRKILFAWVLYNWSSPLSMFFVLILRFLCDFILMKCEIIWFLPLVFLFFFVFDFSNCCLSLLMRCLFYSCYYNFDFAFHRNWVIKATYGVYPCYEERVYLVCLHHTLLFKFLTNCNTHSECINE
jgi:hypothetical protein